jgi:polyphosphate kinase
MPYKETIHEPFQDFFYFDRDLSWLFFNGRVLMEAEKESVPLLERINFLSIFSSNLDEFYRVRMPALVALHKLYKKQKVGKKEAARHADVVKNVRDIISSQQERFGKTLREILPKLEEAGVILYYGRPVPPAIGPELTHYFFTEVLAFLQPHNLSEDGTTFFPENNQLYLAATGTGPTGEEKLVVLNIPSQDLPRFYKVEYEGRQHIVFLDDIVKMHLHLLPDFWLTGCYSFKVTRDAELNLDDEYEEDLAKKIERQIAKRDLGLATRFLHEPNVPAWASDLLVQKLELAENVMVTGGRYHNLKDLSSLPANLPNGKYPKWPSVRYPSLADGSLLRYLTRQDILLHTPFHAYDAVLRFFNEAAISPEVEALYITMYRVAADSRIVNALLAAANNGKKVTALIELKARFDEANNIKWAKKLKKAGVQVLYTPNDMKVHAKVVLIRRKSDAAVKYTGLLATGNLNETTARFYTDHILMTSHQEMLAEVEKLFLLFRPGLKVQEKLPLNHLLVAQHNLQEKFLELIDREILHARTGRPARIIIKLNNLEERVLIKKLYAASNAGVQVDLIVRSICCLVPDVPGMSSNIRVRRIVDRFLEHGRIYVFHNGGVNDIYLGSADWMNRNIYRRMEVCFPLYNEGFKSEILRIIELQLNDNTQAVEISSDLANVPVTSNGETVRSQEAIYRMLSAVKQKDAQETGSIFA